VSRLKICIIGKYPRSRAASACGLTGMPTALLRSGHEVHVVTNAKEAVSPFRMYMRAEDWARCEASYGARLGHRTLDRPGRSIANLYPDASPS